METIMDRSIDIGKLIPQPDDDVIVCRCEEVTKGEIRQAVHDGMRTLNESEGICAQGWDYARGRPAESWFSLS